MYGITNQEIKGIILTPRGYRLWEKIFKYSNTELNIDLITLINNVIATNHDASFNLLSSNFYSTHLLPYFSTLSNSINVVECDNELLQIICSILSSLLVIEYKEEEKIKEGLINSQLVLINLSKTKNKVSYESIMYGLSKGRYLNIQLIQDAIMKTDLIFNIVHQLKFYENEIIALFSTRFIGIYQSENDLPYEINIKLIDLFVKELDNTYNAIRKRDALWSLSNLILMPQMVKAILDKGILSKFIDIYNTENVDIRSEALYCIYNLIVSADFNEFLHIMKLNILELLIETLKNSNHEKTIKLALESIFYSLKYGEVLTVNMGYNPVNIKLINLGGFDLLTSLQNSKIGQNVEIDSSIRNIMANFFKEEDKENRLLNEYCNPDR